MIYKSNSAMNEAWLSDMPDSYIQGIFNDLIKQGFEATSVVSGLIEEVSLPVGSNTEIIIGLFGGGITVSMMKGRTNLFSFYIKSHDKLENYIANDLPDAIEFAKQVDNNNLV